MSKPVRKKVQVEVRQLDEVAVEFISLVDRAATRIPFRILKSEGKKMLNLSEMFFARKSATPQIVGVVLSPDVNAEATSSLVAKELGFESKFLVTEETGVQVLRKSEGDTWPENAVVVQVTKDLGLVVKTVEKGLMTYPDSNDFATNVAKAGFWPGYRMAAAVLDETLSNIAMGDGDQGTTVAQVTKALDDFKGYIAGLVNAMPAEVFKAEGLTLPMKETEKPVETVDTNVTEGETEEVAKAEDESVPDTTPPDTDVTPEENEVAKSESSELQPILTAMTEQAELTKSLSGTMKTLAASMTELINRVNKSDATMTALSEQVKAVEAVAQQAKDSILGTETPDPEAAPVTKRDGKKGGMFDSAFRFEGFEVA